MLCENAIILNNRITSKVSILHPSKLPSLKKNLARIFLEALMENVRRLKPLFYQLQANNKVNYILTELCKNDNKQGIQRKTRPGGSRWQSG